LISADSELEKSLINIWPVDAVSWHVYDKIGGAIENIFNNPPDLLVVDIKVSDMDSMELIKLVKGENVYRQVPVVLCLNEIIPKNFNKFYKLELDDFLIRPINKQEAKARLSLTWNRATRALDANPLTKLPGNTSIIQKIQELIDLKQDFALGYLDLDHFKAFNDKYGFTRGDEVLMMTSRIMVNTVKSLAGIGGYVGHIGGDDFVFIVEPEKAEECCKSIITNFDSIVPRFYDLKDRIQGAIYSIDRQGQKRRFPMMAVSIAVVFNLAGCLDHYGQASHLATSLKKIAKKNPRSSYILDRRKES
jgi:diguanylate cyclase (GGDEF)-like protein